MKDILKFKNDVAKYIWAFSYIAKIEILELLLKKCNFIRNDLVEGIIKPP